MKKYISNVKKAIQSGSASRRKLLSTLKQSVRNYVAEHPDYTYADLEQNFGTPTDIAESYYATLDPIAEQKKRCRKTIIAVVAALILICISIFCIFKAKEYHNKAEPWTGFYIEEIIIHEQSEYIP